MMVWVPVILQPLIVVFLLRWDQADHHRKQASRRKDEVYVGLIVRIENQHSGVALLLS